MLCVSLLLNVWIPPFVKSQQIGSLCSSTSNTPTWNQQMCVDDGGTSSIKPSWCKYANPFSSVPFLFSDNTYPGLPDTSEGILCDGEDGTYQTTLDGKVLFAKNGDINSVKISPRDTCRYISKINTIEFDDLPEGMNRYVVFGLVTGEIVLVNFNNEETMMVGKTSE